MRVGLTFNQKKTKNYRIKKKRSLGTAAKFKAQLVA